MGLVGVAESQGRVGRRQAPPERLDGVFGPRDLPDRAAREPRRPSHAALERARRDPVDVALQRLGDDRVADDQALTDQAIDEHVKFPGVGISQGGPSIRIRRCGRNLAGKAP